MVSRGAGSRARHRNAAVDPCRSCRSSGTTGRPADLERTRLLTAVTSTTLRTRLFVAFRPMAAITELTADVWPGIPKIHDIVMLRRKLVGGCRAPVRERGRVVGQRLARLAASLTCGAEQKTPPERG